MATITYQGLEVLYTRQQIAERVAEMGAEITRDLKGEKLVMVGVLKGAAPESSLDDARATLQLILLAYRSAETRTAQLFPARA